MVEVLEETGEGRLRHYDFDFPFLESTWRGVRNWLFEVALCTVVSLGGLPAALVLGTGSCGGSTSCRCVKLH